MNEAGDGFVDTHSNEGSGYFSWDESVDMFSKDKNLTINGKHYYSAQLLEWRGIIPDYNGHNNVRFDGKVDTKDYEEEIMVGGVVETYTADYKSFNDGKTYALRFKGAGNTHLSAYRYEHKDNPSGSGSMATITVRYLGPENADVTVEDFANEEWWNVNNEEDIVRVLPSCGYFSDSSKEVNELGKTGYYWFAPADVADPDEKGRRVMLNSWWLIVDGKSINYSDGFPIRLFSAK